MSSRQGGPLLNVIAVAVGAAALVAAVFTSLPRIPGYGGDGIGTSVDQQPGSPGAGAARMTYDIDDLVSAHLFGDPEQAEQGGNVVEAPETRLQLKLMGMISSSNERYARAIIGVGSAGANAYGVGDSVEDTDASIHSVDPGRVLLSRDGAVESLHFQKPGVSLTGSGPAPAED